MLNFLINDKKNDVGQIRVPLMEKLTFGKFVPFFKLCNDRHTNLLIVCSINLNLQNILKKKGLFFFAIEKLTIWQAIFYWVGGTPTAKRLGGAVITILNIKSGTNTSDEYLKIMG